jgi:hypothetical protein
MMRHALPIVAILALCTPAAAQTVDAEGAKKLADTLSRYVGAPAFDKGIVKVAVDGDAYKIDIDLDVLAALVPKQNLVRFDFSPYALRVKPRSDGTWDVTGGLGPDGSFEFEGPEGRQRIAWTIAKGEFTGIYAPELATFTSAKGSYSALTMTSSDPVQQTDVLTGAGTVEIKASKTETGGIEFESTQTFTDFVERVTITDGGSSLPFAVKAPDVTLVATGSGLRSKALLDLLAFAVANADEAKMKANQAELKTLLLAALPLWDEMNGGYEVNGITVETPFGNAGLGTLGVDMSFDGITEGGELSYDIEVEGLELPAGVVPAWSQPLLPSDFVLSFSATNINLDAAARTLIGALDLTKEPPVPEEVLDRLSAEFQANPPNLIIGRSTVSNGDTELAAEGEMSFAGGKPDMTVTVDVTGFDKAVAVVQAAAATDPDAQQAFPPLLAAKGFAKTLPDGRLQWKVEASPDGSVRINGAVVKPADPQ